MGFRSQYATVVIRFLCGNFFYYKVRFSYFCINNNNLKIYHKELAAGRWFELSFAEQMGNIGSEVHRAINWFLKKDERFKNAFERALELFDLTISDKRWLSRNKEICRSREYFCMLLFDTVNSNELEKDLQSFDKYFTDFAVYAGKNK